MKSLANGLTAAGQIFGDNDLIIYILSGLGLKYDSVVVNLTSRGDRVTLPEVQFLWHYQEMHIEQLNYVSTDFSAPSANYVAKNKMNFVPSNSGRSLSYRGHGRGRGRGNQSRVMCQLCNKPGHPAAKCYHRFDVAFAPLSSNSNPSLNTYVGHQNGGGQQAFVANSSQHNNSEDSNRYMDSGATNHVGDNAGNLHTQHEYNGNEYEEGSFSREG
ncbi:uncharacterized protein LOC133807396 [Humulus lupulus]|uniref:uncharacterized protein LOC133807396 n=1 Tax=Humulus lupulus TaxID=3486 RepID=UPI002B400EB3|nr:uncharacterized protein LOC133807396 [Humulus lupulus]